MDRTKATDEESQQQTGKDQEPWWRIAQNWRIWYLAVIWTLVTTAMDGLVFWGAMLLLPGLA